MTVSDHQVRKLMSVYTKTGSKPTAALSAGMSTTTGRKYLRLGLLPSELKSERSYRTRKDPFEDVWDELEGMLKDAPEFQAKTLFEFLCRKYPNRFESGQLRTLQRRVSRWRASEGPGKEVMFEQVHQPGEAMQTDWTWGDALNITILGEAFSHKLAHVRLPFSNWSSATVCRSESMLSLRAALNRAIARLGAVPKVHQTDNSSAATHSLATKERAFNVDYLSLMDHFGLKPRTIAIGKPNQNGDVESGNGHLKSRLKQYLLLRGHRDFESVAAYQLFVDTIVDGANSLVEEAMKVELKAMRSLVFSPAVEYTDSEEKVSRNSTIRVKGNRYSVPSRLIGYRLKVRLFEDRLEARYQGKLELKCERLLGKDHARLDYRHIIDSLVRKPGAMGSWRHREALFPSLVFRQAYDQLNDRLGLGRRADLVYLRLLQMAKNHGEHEVQLAITLMFEEGGHIDVDAIADLVCPRQNLRPLLSAPVVELAAYDRLLQEVA